MYDWSLPFIIGSTAILIFLIITSKKYHMNIHYLIVWILWAVFIAILSLFPHLIVIISDLLNIATPSLAILVIFILLLYLISYYLFIKSSNQNDRINKLTYEVAELKKEINELKKGRDK